MGTTQQARDQYREHIAGFYTSGKSYGKPYLKNGWRWPLVRYAAGGVYTNGYKDLPVHPAAVQWHMALASTFLYYGYTFNESAGGTVNMRNITGASADRIRLQVSRQYPYATSLHAHGLCLDINPSKNPYGSSRPDELDLPKWQEMITAAKEIRTIDKILVTKWGGDWSNDDDMHFECSRCTRSQLERGIDFSSVKGWDAYRAWANNPTVPPPPPTTPPIEEDELAISRGDEPSKACAEAQKAMRLFFGQNNGTWDPWEGVSIYDGQPFSPGEDGDPGSTFESNTKNVQSMLGLPTTGVFDGMTASYVLAKYGGGGGVTLTQVDQKIAAHTAIGTAHSHRHSEGTTGGPVA